MDTEALRWFQQVADGVTVTEVGELYWVTQSGVSRGLARLEAEVGTPLLRRTGRTLRMTTAGAAFKRHVDALLNDLDDGLAAVSQLIDPDTGTVSVAFQLSLGTWLVPALVSSFHAAHPQVAFALQQTRDELNSAVLAGDRVDLEITALRQTDPGVRWHRLLTEPLYLAVPGGHPLARRQGATRRGATRPGATRPGANRSGATRAGANRSGETRPGSAAGSGQPDGAPAGVDLAAVQDEPFVGLRLASLLRQQGHALCEAAGFAPRIAFEADDLPTVRGFVAAGLGVAIMPAPHPSDPATPSGPVRYLPVADPSAVREIGLAWSAERRLLPAAELFRQHVVDTAKQHRLPS